MAEGIVIRRADRHQQPRALWLVFADQPPRLRPQMVRRCLDQAQSGERSLEGLAVALDQGQLVAACWGQILPGRTAIVWPPRSAEAQRVEAHRRLLAWMDDHLPAAGVRLAQAVLPPEADADARLFRATGYGHQLDLLYLACGAEKLASEAPAGALQFAPFRPDQRQRLGRVIEQTYEQTLDCPMLNGVRPIDEVVAGYCGTGVFHPELWFFVRHAGQDVGCLLLSDHPDQDQLELVYMGLVPAARGRRWGEQITRFAQWVTRRAGRSRLVLAVDAGNAPALAAYQAAGMEHWQRRTVLLKVFPHVA